jgi:RNA 2',3'-cyclic 3'-phosphodiesterase
MLRTMIEAKSAKLRLFAAVFPQRDALIELERWLAAQRAVVAPAGLRWVAGSSLHLTLQFFGSVAEAQLEAFADACARAAVSCKPFRLRFSGAGAFPNPRHARVVWLGVSAGADELRALAGAVESAVRPLGWSREQPAFTPHLSVARLSTAADASPLLAALQAVDVRTPVTQLALVRSRLGAPAARYEVIARFELDPRE